MESPPRALWDAERKRKAHILYTPCTHTRMHTHCSRETPGASVVPDHPHCHSSPSLGSLTHPDRPLHLAHKGWCCPERVGNVTDSRTATVWQTESQTGTSSLSSSPARPCPALPWFQEHPVPDTGGVSLFFSVNYVVMLEGIQRLILSTSGG